MWLHLCRHRKPEHTKKPWAMSCFPANVWQYRMSSADCSCQGHASCATIFCLHGDGPHGIVVSAKDISGALGCSIVS